MSLLPSLLTMSLRRVASSLSSRISQSGSNSCNNRIAQSFFHSITNAGGSSSNNIRSSSLQLLSHNNSRLILNGTLSSPHVLQIRGMASKRHKKIIKMAKGLRGRANRCYTIALPRVLRVLRRQYIGRKLRKRDFRRLWITRINASSRMYGMGYRHFVHGLSLSNVSLNRKVLADLAVSEPLSFRSVVELAKQSKTIHGSWPLKEKKKITFSHFLTGADRYGPKKLKETQSTA